MFLVRDGKAARVVLEPGYSDAQQVESLSGIEVGEKIVVVGQNGLKQDTKVRLVDEEKNSKDSERQIESS